MTLAVDPVQSVSRFQDTQPTFLMDWCDIVFLSVFFVLEENKRSLGVSMKYLWEFSGCNCTNSAVTHTPGLYTLRCVFNSQRDRRYPSTEWIKTQESQTFTLRIIPETLVDWSGLGSSGVANQYRLVLVETFDEGITENPLSLSLIMFSVRVTWLSPLPPIQVRTTQTIK